MPCACIVVFLHADAENQGSSEKRPLRRVKLQKLWGLSSPFLHIIHQSKRSVVNIFHPLLDEPADLLRKSGGHLQLYFLPQTYWHVSSRTQWEVSTWISFQKWTTATPRTISRNSLFCFQSFLSDTRWIKKYTFLVFQNICISNFLSNLVLFIPRNIMIPFTDILDHTK